MARWVLNVLLIYKELWLTEFKSFPFPFYFFLGLHCPIEKIWGFETARVKWGKKRDAAWVGERKSFIWVYRHILLCAICVLPFLACQIGWHQWENEITGTGSMMGVLCVCVYVRERWWLVGACWLWTMSSKRTHSCRASVMRPIYSSPLSTGRHTVPHFRFYCIASVSPSRGARRGAVATAVIWPGKVKFTLWQAIAKAWDVKSGRVLRPFHVWVATFWSERKVTHCRYHTV